MTQTSPKPGPPPSRWLLLLLVALTAAAPVALQIFLPALPAIQAHFSVSIGVVQYTLTASILANAVATLVYGPLSDRFGRRPVLLCGLSIFVLGSLFALVATSISWLVFSRILQAAGAAAGMVMARTIIRDLYETEQAARALAFLTMAMVVAPMIAPTIGAVLVDLFDWHAVFVALAVFSALLLSWAFRFLVETRPAEAANPGKPGLLQGAINLLREPWFIAYNLQSTFAISSFFSFLAGATYFMVNILGRSATEYGLFFVLVSGSYMAGNFLTTRFVRRFGIHKLIITGSCLTLAAICTSVLLMFSFTWSPLLLFVPAAVASIGHGLSIPNSVAGAMSVHKSLAGTASGVIGFTQMFVAAVVSQLVGELQNGTPFPMLAFMSGCAALSLAGYFVHRLDTNVHR